MAARESPGGSVSHVISDDRSENGHNKSYMDFINPGSGSPASDLHSIDLTDVMEMEELGEFDENVKADVSQPKEASGPEKAGPAGSAGSDNANPVTGLSSADGGTNNNNPTLNDNSK